MGMFWPGGRAATWGIAVVLMCAACLPDRKTAEEVQQTLEQGADVAPAAGCGNGAVEPPEQCDLAGATLCTGCDKCERRRTMLVSSAQDSAAVSGKGLANLVDHAADGFSVEFWFAPDALPAADAPVLISALAGAGLVGSDGSPAFGVMLVTEAAKSATYVTCAYWPHFKDLSNGYFIQGANPVQLTTWHHVRCAWSGKDLQMRLWLDGQGPTSSAKAPSKPASLFDANSLFVVGAISEKGKPFYRGRIDELRVLVGNGAAEAGLWRYRYLGNEAHTQLLLHMDEEDGATVLKDSSPSALNLPSAAKGLPRRAGQTALHFQDEDCYGYTQEQAQCLGAAPFCP